MKKIMDMPEGNVLGIFRVLDGVLSGSRQGGQDGQYEATKELLRVLAAAQPRRGWQTRERRFELTRTCILLSN